MRRRAIALGWAGGLGLVAAKAEIVWPLPPCSAPEIASASPAPAVSDSASLGALPFVVFPRAVTAAFVAGLDEANRPILKCYVAASSDPALVRDASVAAAGLALSTPHARSRATEEGRYLIRLSTNLGFAWVSAPPPYPLLPGCGALRWDLPQHAVPEAPRPVTKVRPRYPDIALAEEIEGSVIVWLDIFSNGAASPVCVDGGTPAGWFEQAALDAVAQWRFAPQDGMGRYRVTVRFVLQ